MINLFLNFNKTKNFLFNILYGLMAAVRNWNIIKDIIKLEIGGFGFNYF